MATIPRDAVRLLISDTGTGTSQLLTDTQIDTFLEIEAASIKLAAAQALDTIASSEALVSKVIKTQDLATDGPKVAAELRKHAAALRAQAAAEASDADEYFELVDVVEAPPGYGWL